MLQGRSSNYDLKERSWELLQKVLTGNNGIEKRHFVTGDLTALSRHDAEGLNHLFEAEAPQLSMDALKKALRESDCRADELDALIVCTCTGYLCPGLSSYIAEKLELPQRAYLQDIVGLGCGAAIPTLRSASGFLANHPEATVAVVAVEVCSAAFYIDDDPGVLVSFCLFGDGASASIWKGRPWVSQKPIYRLADFDTLHLPQDREKLRFVNHAGLLKNQLHWSIPKLSSKAVSRLYRLRNKGVAHPRVITHSGGRDVLTSIQEALELDDLPESRAVLREAGNLSSPSVLLAAEKHLRQASPADNLWLCSFGAGFACHSVSATCVQ